MRLGIVIVLITNLLYSHKLSAQCLSGSEVWNKVEYFRNSTLPESKQLSELLQLQKRCISCNATTDSAYSNLLQRLGALYYLTGDLSNAIKFLQESIKVGSLKNGKTNPRYLSKGYFNLAMSYKDSKLYSHSMAAFDSCIAYSNLHADNLLFALRSYRGLSNLFLWKGDYKQSIIHEEKAEGLARTL